MTRHQVANGSPLARAAGLGAVAGLRSFSAPTMLAARLAGAPTPLFRRRPKVLGVRPGRGTARVLGALALGEMAGDKVPGLPARTSPPVLGWRLLTGAVVGAAIADAGRASPWTGGLIGAAAALVSTVAATRLRLALGRHVPDPLLGLAEDALVATAFWRWAR